MAAAAEFAAVPVHSDARAVPQRIAPVPQPNAPRTPEELRASLGGRYRQASKAEKTRILDELVTRTGYHRKHAVRLLRSPAATTPRGEPLFDDAVRTALAAAWDCAGQVGSRRLRQLLPELLPDLERRELLPADRFLRLRVRGKLLTASAATIDRLLAPARARRSVRAYEELLHSAAAMVWALPDQLAAVASLPPPERLYLETRYRAILAELRRSTNAVATDSSASPANDLPPAADEARASS